MKRKLLCMLVKGAETTGMMVAGCIELVLIDLVYGKAKYRKRGPKMRPIIHRTIHRRTVVIQQPVVVKERV